MTSFEVDHGYYTAYLACNTPVAEPVRYLLRETGTYRFGMYRLYDETTQSYGPSNSLALNLLLFTPVSSWPATQAPPPRGVAGVVRPPSFRPLILIHGLGGKPEDWVNGRTNYVKYPFL